MQCCAVSMSHAFLRSHRCVPPQARGVPAHDVPKIVAIAGQRIGMLSHAATSIADLGKDTDGERLSLILVACPHAAFPFAMSMTCIQELP